MLVIPQIIVPLQAKAYNMYDQIREDIFFFMFYAAVAMLSLNASCYLLFRRANAIAPDIKSSARLRRWTAAFFAAIALCHLWYLPTYFLTSSDDMMLGSLIAGLLDSMTVHIAHDAARPQTTAVACSRDGSTTRCWNSGVHCQPERHPSADVTYLYPAVGHRFNHIYGARGQTVWTLAA